MISRKKIWVHVLCKTLHILNYKFKVLQFELSSNKDLEKYITSKGFVEKNDGWFDKGFIFIRFLNDCCEIRVINKVLDIDWHSKEVLHISTNKDVLDSYIKYLTEMTKK